MKTLVVLASIILFTVSGQPVSAKSLTEKSAATEYSGNIPQSAGKLFLSFYCTVTVDGIVVMKGIAEGTSAEELEKRLEKQYAGIFYDEKSPPVIKVKCVIIEKKQ